MVRRILHQWACAALLLSFLAGGQLIPAEVHAQDDLPTIEITSVEVTAFPEVRVYLRGENLGNDPARLAFELGENGVSRPIQQAVLEPVGTQTILLVDASANIMKTGLTNQHPRYTEISLAVRHLLGRGVLDGQFDWLAAMAPNSDGELQTLLPNGVRWTRDHGLLSNALYIYKPEDNIGATPLFDLLHGALDAFADPGLDARQERSIIVFSDGIDVVSALLREEVVSRAREENVRVHTVLLGNGQQSARNNLRALANLTGGIYEELDAEEALDGLWSTILMRRNQVSLGYHSASSHPEEVVVRATVGGGQTVTAKRVFPPIELLPVTVQIVEPQSGLTLMKKAPEHDTPLAELEPKTQVVRLAFTWPDGRPRQLTRVEYTIGNQVYTVQQAPFETATLPVAGLDTGDYSLTVRVEDELRLWGQSRTPVQFKVQVSRPPLKEAVATAVSVAPPTPVETAWNIATLLIAAGALLAVIVLFFLFRNFRKLGQGARELIEETIKAFGGRGGRRPGAQGAGGAKAPPVRARLVRVQGPVSTPQEISISRNHRMGRSPQQADIVIDEPHISRAHCIVYVDDTDGSVLIRHDGGANGTYVNDLQVQTTPHRLHSGDVVWLGPEVAYRVVLVPDDGTVPAPAKRGTSSAADGDETLKSM